VIAEEAPPAGLNSAFTRRASSDLSSATTQPKLQPPPLAPDLELGGAADVVTLKLAAPGQTVVRCATDKPQTTTSNMVCNMGRIDHLPISPMISI
jgi:hypothetical protein